MRACVNLLLDFHTMRQFMQFVEKNIKFVLSENFICVKDLGIQISSVYLTGKTIEEFIPRKSIADVVINEVICMVRVCICCLFEAGITDVNNYLSL